MGARVLCLLAASLAVFAACGASAKTLVTEAKILKVTERGYVLAVGTQPLAVEDTPATRRWSGRKPAERGAFGEGALVVVRLNVDTDPPTLREIADRETQAWLDGVRKNFVKGTIESRDAKYLVLKLEDGQTFAYRATDKSKLELQGKAVATLADLEPGMTVWAKGRLLPTLDTWLAELRDTPPVLPPKAPKAPERPKLQPLPPAGSHQGSLRGVTPGLRLLEVEAQGRTLHFVCPQSCEFRGPNGKLTIEGLRAGATVKISYKRDAQGRLLASLVEVVGP
ncbi:MAG: hypothetical protein WHU10_10800 [Fimbriimonadales bacterium]